MAKLKAPLMSLGASGKLANTLVFFPWKGLNVVREYVIPSNPDTALQQIQRAYMTACVAAIHAAQAEAAQPLGSADQVAYAALANAKGITMTWFNQIVKLWAKNMVAGTTPIVYRGERQHDLTVTSINLTLWINEETPDDLNAGKFYFGSSPTNLIYSEVATLSSGDNVQIFNVDLSAFLTAGRKYYYQFRPDAGDPCVLADSGIYSFWAE